MVAAAPAVPQPARLPQPRPATAPQGATLPTQPTRVVDQAAAAAPQGPQGPAAPQSPPTPPAPQVAAAPLPPRPAPLQAALPSQNLPPPQPAYAPGPPPPPAYGPAPLPPPAVAVADLRTLPPDEAYDLAVMEDTVPVYEEFLMVYPNDPRADWVRTTLALRVDAIAWRYAVVVNTPAAYAAYAARYPGGIYVDEAVRLRMQPRVRPIDVVFAPRVLAPPPAPRIALPLIQMRRANNAPIALPVVYSRPGRFNSSATIAPGHQLPGFNPAAGARFNAAVAPSGPNGFPRERQMGPGPASPGTPRVNAVNVPNTPNAAPSYRPPVANVAPQLKPAQPQFRPPNPQFRPPPQQRAQLGPRPKGPPPEKCGGRGCRR
jgi:hypothetical protein